jgi:hypothetical protein
MEPEPSQSLGAPFQTGSPVLTDIVEGTYTGGPPVPPVDPDIVSDTTKQRRRRGRRQTIELNLLDQESVEMTVLAQDAATLGPDRLPLITTIGVVADRLDPGPRSHRFHVVDIQIGSNIAAKPVELADQGGWRYVDKFAKTPSDRLVEDGEFRAQNVFAVASHTLGLFEQHLGRRIPWRSGKPHLYLVPQAKIEANAAYSPDHDAVLFGWLPAVGDQPPLYTCLSYGIIAHEVSHAVLDGLRPRFAEPGLPDQPAFHEALADLVALFSVFDNADVVKDLLPGAGQKVPDSFANADTLRKNPLFGLAKELGQRIHTDRVDALRRSVELEPGTSWRTGKDAQEPHKMGEVLVAAFMRTFATIWANRIDDFARRGGMDRDRVAEEGAKAARHLLTMALRSLDYLPPVELEFADVIDSALTADARVAPDDPHHYRNALRAGFADFGIVPPTHRIIDFDRTSTRPRYEHLNFESMRTSREEMYEFIWNNSRLLGVDLGYSTWVERVLSATRVGPDGLVIEEVVADYVQRIDTTAGNLPKGMRSYRLPSTTPVQLWGGGVLVFDQFGRFRLHQRKPLLDVRRQNQRLQYLVTKQLKASRGGFGASMGTPVGQRFAMLHRETSERSW